jgi:hypothetical protein
VPIVLKSGSLNLLETLEPVKACNWIALRFLLEISQRLRDQIFPHHEDLISEIRPPGTEISHTGAYNLVVAKSSRQTNVAKISLNNTEAVFINICSHEYYLYIVSIVGSISIIAGTIIMVINTSNELWDLKVNFLLKQSLKLHQARHDCD